jgi:hypothetical protein
MLSEDERQACMQSASESPVFRLALHPGLPDMADSLSQHFGHYQGALMDTKAYLGGLTQVEVQQTAVAREVEQFFREHPEALAR